MRWKKSGQLFCHIVHLFRFLSRLKTSVRKRLADFFFYLRQWLTGEGDFVVFPVSRLTDITDEGLS